MARGRGAKRKGRTSAPSPDNDDGQHGGRVDREKLLAGLSDLLPRGSVDGDDHPAKADNAGGPVPDLTPAIDEARQWLLRSGATSIDEPLAAFERRLQVVRATLDARSASTETQWKSDQQHVKKTIGLLENLAKQFEVGWKRRPLSPGKCRDRRLLQVARLAAIEMTADPAGFLGSLALARLLPWLAPDILGAADPNLRPDPPDLFPELDGLALPKLRPRAMDDLDRNPFGALEAATLQVRLNVAADFGHVAFAMILNDIARRLREQDPLIPPRTERTRKKERANPDADAVFRAVLALRESQGRKRPGSNRLADVAQEALRVLGVSYDHGIEERMRRVLRGMNREKADPAGTAIKIALKSRGSVWVETDNPTEAYLEYGGRDLSSRFEKLRN